MPKTLYVDIKFDYGIESRGPNYIGQLGMLPAIQNLGHEVEPFYFDLFFSQDAPVQMQSDFLQKVNEFKPDFIFFACMHRNEFSPHTISSASNQAVTIGWFGDDHWRFDSYTKNYLKSFKYCVTTDALSVKKYIAASGHPPILSQWAAIDSYLVDEPIESIYDYEILFIGGHHPYRKWFIQRLRESGFNVAVFGNGWNTRSLSNDEFNQAMKKSKICLNIGNSTSWDIRYLISNPRAVVNNIRSQKTAAQIKARNFEIPFHGGFQLTEYVPGIEEYFNIGHELVCFSNVDEAMLLAEHYLESSKEREGIRTAGHRRALAEHGYNHRIKQIFGQIQKNHQL